MTGEMVMPKNAELGEEDRKGRTTAWGSIMGDESLLIRPNYPDIFELSDKLKKLGVGNEVRSFDVYSGLYIQFDVSSFPGNPVQRRAAAGQMVDRLGSEERGCVRRRGASK